MSPILVLWSSPSLASLAGKVDTIAGAGPGHAGLYRSIGHDSIDAGVAAERLSEAYRELINLGAADTTLHAVAAGALFDPGFLDRLTRLAGVLEALPHKVSLHIVALRGNLARLFPSEANPAVTDDADALDSLAERSGATYTLVEDFAANGSAINFDEDSLAKYLAMFLGGLIQSYHTLLPPALIAGGMTRHIAFGAASFRFDAEAECERLRGRAFIDALERAGALQDTVDAGNAMVRAQKTICGLDHLYPAFMDGNVAPLIREGQLADSHIAAAIQGPMAAEWEVIERRLTGFIDDPGISFPEKEGTLAMILGRDNPRLRGQQYEEDTLLADDVCSAALDEYVAAFNNCAPESRELPVRGDFPALKKTRYDAAMDREVESSENKEAFNPLPAIKKLKQEIFDLTAFIRRKTDELAELESLENQREAVRQSIDHAWHRPAPAVAEQPLNEEYMPPPGYAPAESADLRPFFSKIKEQGEIGACATFAAVAMYEAAANRGLGPGEPKADLSERFVFYHSNVLKGRPEGGSNFFDQLAVLGTEGVCSESMCPYSVKAAEEPPSRAAAEEAATHRVLKALQIPLDNGDSDSEWLAGNHRRLTSALSQGYPVGISLRIADDFGRQGPYIAIPEEGTAAGYSFHAMVLAGYSEADKCYIVRNSWGESFGDKGYCYISAAYIDDPAYNNFAFIIAETTDDAGAKTAPPLTAPFAGTETQIKIAATRNVIDEARTRLRSRQRLYDETYKYYSRLTQRLGLPACRKKLREAAEKSRARQLAQIEQNRAELADSFVQTIKDFRRGYLKAAISLSGTALAFDLAAIATLSLRWEGADAIFLWVTAIVLTVITVFTWINYKWRMRRKRRELNDRLAALAAAEQRLRRELSETQLRFHVAGMWIDSFHSLSMRLNSLYNRLAAFNDRLKAWHADESRKAEETRPAEGRMFIRVTDERLTDSHYLANKDAITGNIDLSQAFRRFQTDPESFGQTREEINLTTAAAIQRLFSDFNMADYLMGTRYGYLPGADRAATFNRLLSLAQPACQYRAADAELPSHTIAVAVPPDRENQWRDANGMFFPLTPMMLPVADQRSISILTLVPMSAAAVR